MRADNDNRQMPEYEYTICSPGQSDGSGEVKMENHREVAKVVVNVSEQVATSGQLNQSLRAVF